MDPMLSQVLRTAYGPLGDFAKKVSRNPELWDAAFRRFLRGENPWKKDKDSGDKKDILHFESSLLVEGQNPFVARDHFKADMSPTAPVKIRHLGEDFKNHFLPKVEEDVKPTTLVRNVFRDGYAYVPRVFCKLQEGYETEVMLAHLWEALREQRNGENLSTGLLYSERNFLFMFDTDRVLWVVHVTRNFHDGSNWVRDGWVIDASPFCGKTFPDLHTSFPYIISSVK